MSTINQTNNIARALFNLGNMIANPKDANTARNATQAINYWQNILKNKPMDEQAAVQVMIENWMAAGKITETTEIKKENTEMTNNNTRNTAAHIYGTDKQGVLHPIGSVVIYLVMKAAQMAIDTEKAVMALPQSGQFKDARSHTVNAELSKRRQLLDHAGKGLARLNTELGGNFRAHELYIAAVSEYMTDNGLTEQDIPASLRGITQERMAAVRNEMNARQTRQIAFQAEQGLRQDEFKPVNAAEVLFQMIYSDLKNR